MCCGSKRDRRPDPHWTELNIARCFNLNADLAQFVHGRRSFDAAAAAALLIKCAIPLPPLSAIESASQSS